MSADTVPIVSADEVSDRWLGSVTFSEDTPEV